MLKWSHSTISHLFKIEMTETPQWGRLPRNRRFGHRESDAAERLVALGLQSSGTPGTAWS